MSYDILFNILVIIRIKGLNYYIYILVSRLEFNTLLLLKLYLLYQFKIKNKVNYTLKFKLKPHQTN